VIKERFCVKLVFVTPSPRPPFSPRFWRGVRADLWEQYFAREVFEFFSSPSADLLRKGSKNQDCGGFRRTGFFLFFFSAREPGFPALVHRRSFSSPPDRFFFFLPGEVASLFDRRPRISLRVLCARGVSSSLLKAGCTVVSPPFFGVKRHTFWRG